MPRVRRGTTPPDLCPSQPVQVHRRRCSEGRPIAKIQGSFLRQARGSLPVSAIPPAVCTFPNGSRHLWHPEMTALQTW